MHPTSRFTVYGECMASIACADMAHFQRQRPATITTTPYGTYTHGTPQYGKRSWYRMDTWHGTQHHADDGHRDRFRCTDLHDDSPGYHGPYDGARCGCCWLGHCHTQAYHDRAIAVHNLEETLHAGRRYTQRCPAQEGGAGHPITREAYTCDGPKTSHRKDSTC